jgi:putative ABC transport system ATP-binding protein
VGIARAIVAHPKVVVADEPTGSLDNKTSDQIQILLTRLNRELNITLVMVTHDSDAAKIASRQLVLDEGKIVEASAYRTAQLAAVSNGSEDRGY